MSRPRIAGLINFGRRTAYGAVMLTTPGPVGGPWARRPSPAASSDVPLRGVRSSVRQRAQLPDGGLRACLLTGGGSVLTTVALIAVSH